MRKANRILDPEILTIGFARRFATYKRGALLFSDRERLARLLNDTTRPVQFIFAGKSHPRDEGGKALIQQVYKFSREAGFENRIVFVEDYDTYIARRLVQGVDLWLNNPLRPLEASGTSGMKLPPNGGLNLSVLDGWWCESYNGKNGWAIGAEIEDGSVEFQSEVDAGSLYQLLENQIIPLYYAKPDGKLPLAWLQLMRESIRSVTPVFNTHRMVKEYTERLYPAAKAHDEFARDDCRAATELSQWKAHMRKDWPQVRIYDVQVGNDDRQNILVGETLQVSAKVHLGAVDPEHVRVEAYHGESDNDAVRNPTVTASAKDAGGGNGNYIYRARFPPRRAARMVSACAYSDLSASRPDSRVAAHHLVVANAFCLSTLGNSDPVVFLKLEQNITCSISSIAYNCAMDVSVKQLEEAVAIRKQIDQLQSRLAGLLRGSSAPSGAVSSAPASAARTGRKRRGGLSAAGRARIAAAARARWARVKATNAASSAPKAKTSSGKKSRRKRGGITPAGRRKLSQMMKARWAARRKG